MARRKRTHAQNKAAYARAKSRAISKGYSSPYQERKARKALGLRRGMPSLRVSELPEYALDVLTGRRTREQRAQAKEWSDAHSRIPNSKYSGRMGAEQVADYWHAYIEEAPKGARGRYEKKHRIWAYLHKWKGDKRPWSQEWESESKKVA